MLPTLVFGVAPVAGQVPVERTLEQIRSFPIEGVTLETPPATARVKLENEGFVQVSLFGPPSNPRGWNYARGDVRVSLEHLGGYLVRIERTEQGRRDSDVVDGAPIAQHLRDFFELGDDDCLEAGEGVACTVSDDVGGPTHVITAQIVPYRTVLRATLIIGSDAP